MHLSLLLFALLLGVIHWIDYRHGLRPLASALVNSVPFVVLLLMTRDIPQADVSTKHAAEG